MRDCSCHSHNGYLLKPSGFAQQLSLEGLDSRRVPEYVDRVRSVSALVEAEALHVFDDELLDRQYRRFTHGS